MILTYAILALVVILPLWYACYSVLYDTINKALYSEKFIKYMCIFAPIILIPMLVYSISYKIMNFWL
jgi:hypothetical protein